MTVHIYCRVSKSNNKFNIGTNVNSQVDECVEYCKSNNLDTNTKVYTDEGSARNGNNSSSLFEILNDMNPGDIFITYTVDRLTRSCREGIKFLDELTKKKCKFISVRENVTYDIDDIYGRFTIRNILNHAELESDRTSQRIKKSIADKKSVSSTRFQCVKRSAKRKRDDNDCVDLTSALKRSKPNDKYDQCEIFVIDLTEDSVKVNKKSQSSKSDYFLRSTIK